jgi:hypothetical protein
MADEIWFVSGVVFLVGTFYGLVWFITKRQASDSRRYPNQDESFPWGV